MPVTADHGKDGSNAFQITLHPSGNGVVYYVDGNQIGKLMYRALTQYRLDEGTGKPVLVQDTGFSAPKRSGEGLLVFDTVVEAAEGADRIARDYRGHSEAARWLAKQYFDSATQLAHAAVVVIEAMKMEHAVVAPMDGTVVRLAVEEGQQVQRGDLLADLLPGRAGVRPVEPDASRLGLGALGPHERRHRARHAGHRMVQGSRRQYPVRACRQVVTGLKIVIWRRSSPPSPPASTSRRRS